MVTQKRKTVGAFEVITFPEFGIEDIGAKVDTGAESGALHCTRIAEEKTPEGKVLKFSPFDHPDIEITTRDFTTDFVRSSNGEGQERYFIKTRIVIQDKTYPIILSLADRSEMQWPVLIGRRFLKRFGFLVDVRK